MRKAVCLSLCLLSPILAVTASCALSADAKTPTSKPADVVIGADDPKIQYTGRFDFSDRKGPRFAWSGSSISVRVRAREVSMVMTDGVNRQLDNAGAPFRNWYEILVDGRRAKTVVIDPAKSVYSIFKKPDPSTHTITIFRRTEAYIGVSKFGGLRLSAGGEVLPPPPRPKRRIEVIGDSITAGLNSLTVGLGMFSIAAEDNYVTYGAVAARKLDAEYVCVAYSGGSINGRNGKGLIMPTFHDRTLPDDPKSTWDFRAWQPDVVAIHLSTNDALSPRETRDQCESIYIAFLKKIRRNYPKAHIFCLTGPWRNWGPVQHEFAGGAVKALRKKGDDRIHYLGFDAKIDSGRGDIHPDKETHQRMADVLVKAIRAKLGWK